MEKTSNSPPPIDSKKGFQLLGTPVMLDGLKADYHVEKWNQKRLDCPYDAGSDLYLDRAEPLVERYAWGTLYRCGTSLHTLLIPGVYGMITPRSSAVRSLMGLQVVPGVLDPGYTRELFVDLLDPDPRSRGEGHVMQHIKWLQTGEISVAQLIIQQYCLLMPAKWDYRIVRSIKRGKIQAPVT